MTFNTGKPVPSTDPRDLYDNAENLDKLVNGADPFYADRLGKLRESWSGMENSFNNAQEGRETAFTLSQADKESRFQAFLVSSGYVSKGDYAAGVVIAERNEYVAVSAATTGTSPGLYRPNASATLPLTLTGTWATDSANLVLLGDDVLRQELAYGDGSLVGYRSPLAGGVLRNVNAKLGEYVSVKDFGAVGDGVTDDTDAIQACIDAVGEETDHGVVFFPTGHYRITRGLNLTKGTVSLKGSSSNRHDSVLVGDTGEDFAIDMSGRGNRWMSIEDIYLVSDSSQANPTVNGLLLARSIAGLLCGESYFKNLRINLITSPLSNNGFGSVGVASIGSESNTFTHLYVVADVPFYANASPELVEFDSGSKVVVKQISSAYSSIDPTGASNTENQIDGILLSRSSNVNRSALSINSGAAWYLNLFISRLSEPAETLSSFASAITISNCTSIHIEGDIERFNNPIALYGFNRSHSVKLYAPFRAGYPLVFSKRSITGTVNNLIGSKIDIHPTYSTRNVSATFIKSENTIQITGGEINLYCDLDISDVSTNYIKGVLIKNTDGRAITTNNAQSVTAASSYLDLLPSGLRLSGPDTLDNTGFGFREKTSNYLINSLSDGTINSRTSRVFNTEISANNVFVKVRLCGEGINATPFYSERLFMFRRSGSGAVYALSHSEVLVSSDPGNVAQDLTVVPAVTSATGDPLSFTLTFAIPPGASTISSVAGSCVSSGRP